jgi:transcriptional regulator with XRE-family HTH domain
MSRLSRITPSRLEAIRFSHYTICVIRDYLKAGNGPPPTVGPERLDLMSKEIVAAFGTRLKELRKAKGWTQKELASKVDIRFSQLNKYESGLHAPPLEKLVELAEVLDTDLDYLLTGNRSEGVPLRSTRLLERFRELEEFSSDDRETVLKLIDAMIVKRRVEGALTVGPR